MKEVTLSKQQILFLTKIINRLIQNQYVNKNDTRELIIILAIIKRSARDGEDTTLKLDGDYS